MKFFSLKPARRKSSLFSSFILVTLLLASPLFSFADCAKKKQGKGIFAVVQANQFFDKTKGWKWLGVEKTSKIFEVLQRPYIAGFTYYIPWACLEPREGSYRWDIIDRIVERAEKEKKAVNIGVLWGSEWGPPEWIWKNPDVKKITVVKNRLGADEEFLGVTIFPLDPIYRRKYLHFMEALAAHKREKTNFAFRDDPAINYIAVIGPSNSTGLEIVLHTGKNKNEIEAIKKKVIEVAGSENFIEGYAQEWIRAIEEFIEIFPEKSLGLALHLGLDKKRTVKIAYLVYAYLAEKSYQERVRLMTLTLTGKDWWGYAYRPQYEVQKLIFLLKKSQGEGFSTGLQLIGIAGASTDKEERVRPFDKALLKGVHFGADWIEIFVEDLIHERGYLSTKKIFLADIHPFYDSYIQEVEKTHIALVKQKHNSCY